MPFGYVGFLLDPHRRLPDDLTRQPLAGRILLGLPTPRIPPSACMASGALRYLSRGPS
jgi:hypothetical protein